MEVTGLDSGNGADINISEATAMEMIKEFNLKVLDETELNTYYEIL